MRAAPDRAAPAVNRAAITISIMLATIMQAIDTTIANVALPHIQGSLSAAPDQITWILTSYIDADPDYERRPEPQKTVDAVRALA